MHWELVPSFLLRWGFNCCQWANRTCWLLQGPSGIQLKAFWEQLSHSCGAAVPARPSLQLTGGQPQQQQQHLRLLEGSIQIK